MQQVLHQDVVALARCLMRAPVEKREAYAVRCVGIAFAGDIWRRKTGRAHPLFGDGTLQSACLGLPRAEEGVLDEPEYAKCWISALHAVLDARSAACAGNAKG